MISSLFGDRFRGLSLIGSGATADVYRVEDLQHDGRAFALKHLVRNPRGDRARAPEFRLLATLNHPNLARVCDFGRASDGHAWFTMDLVQGRPIDQVARDLPLAGLLRLFVGALRALRHIHARGFVHFDVKPSNLLVEEHRDREPRVKVVDLGLAGPIGAGRTSHARGSVGYVAPELIRGGVADERADLYSLGAVLYEAIVGRPPFAGPGPAAVLRAHLETRPAFPDTAEDLPGPLRDLVLRMLSKDPRMRPSGALAALIEIAGIGERDAEAETDPSLHLHEPVYLWRDEPRHEIGARLGAIAEREAAGPILVTGTPGVGKSSLLREIASDASLMGLRVFLATARSGDLSPHGLFVAAFRDRRSTAFGPLSGEGSVGPEVEQEMARIADHERYGSKAPRQLHERLARFLRRIAEQAPTALVLQNLDRADAETIDLVAHLIEATAESAIVLVASVNSPDDAPALWSSAAGRKGPAGFLHIPLRPFDRTETLAFLGEMIAVEPEQVPARFADSLLEATDGLPLFVRESVRNAAAEMSGPWPEGLFRSNVARLPASLEAVVLARLGRIPPRTRKLLRFMSVLNAPLSAAEIGAATDSDQSAEDLVLLAAAGLVRQTGEGLAIRSGAIRSTLYRRTRPSERRQFHARVARILEPALDSDGPIGDLAHHALRGGMLDLAVRASLRAAEQSLQAHAPGRAAEQIEAVWAELDEERPAERRRALALLAEARIARDEYQEATTVLESLVRESRRIQDREGESKALWSLSQLARWQGGADEALRLIGEAERAATHGATLTRRGAIASERAEIEKSQGRFDEAATHLEDSAELFREAEDWRGLARTWLIRGDLAFMQHDSARARDHYQRALSISDSVCLALQASAWNRLGMARAELSGGAEALQAFARALELFQQIGDREGEASALNNWGLAERNGGHVERAIELLERALAAYQAAGATPPIAWVLRNIAAYRLEQGNAFEALELLERSRALPLPERWQAISLRADAHLRLMRLDDAARAFEAAIALDPDDEGRTLHGKIGLALVRASRAGGDPSAESRGVERRLAHLSDDVDERLAGLILAYALEVHEIAGDRARIRRAALRLCRIEEAEHSINNLIASRWRCWLTLDAGDVDTALRQTREVIRRAQRLGFKEENRDARRIYARALLRSNRPRKAAAVLYAAMESLKQDWQALGTQSGKGFLTAPRRRALRRELKTALSAVRGEAKVS